MDDQEKELGNRIQALRLQSARTSAQATPLIVAGEVVQNFMSINARLLETIDALQTELKNEREKSKSS